MLQFGGSGVYRKYRSSQRYYRWELPVLLPEPSTAYENWVLDSTEVASEVKPELPLNRKYRSSQRYYRSELPVVLLEPSTA